VSSDDVTFISNVIRMCSDYFRLVRDVMLMCEGMATGMAVPMCVRFCTLYKERIICKVNSRTD
jgi:hypothetical protein